MKFKIGQRCQRGAAMPEYVLMVSLLTLAVVGVIPALQTGATTSLDSAAWAIAGPSPSFVNTTNPGQDPYGMQGGSHVSTLPGGVAAMPAIGLGGSNSTAGSPGEPHPPVPPIP